MYKAQLRKQLGERLQAYRLFGSWARGEATEESDVDLLVVVDALTREEKNQLLDAAYDLSVQAERILSPLIVERKWYRLLQRRERLLAKEIARDGIDL